MESSMTNLIMSCKLFSFCFPFIKAVLPVFQELTGINGVVLGHVEWRSWPTMEDKRCCLLLVLIKPSTTILTVFKS